MFLVVDGRVRVVRDGTDRRQVVHTEGPGATLAEIPLFDGGTLPATAVAVVPTRCLLFTLEAIESAIGRDRSQAAPGVVALAGSFAICGATR